MTYTSGGQPAKAEVTSYDNWREQVYGLNDAWLRGLDSVVTAILVKLQHAPDTPANRKLREWAQGRFDLLRVYKDKMNDPEILSIERAVWSTNFALELHGAGIVNPRAIVGDLFDRIRRETRAGYEGVLHDFSVDFAVGVYQLALSQIPFVQSAWTIFTKEDIFGNKVDGWEYAMAVIDAATQASMMGATMKFSLDHAVGNTTSPIARDYPTEPEVRYQFTDGEGRPLSLDRQRALEADLQKAGITLDDVARKGPAALATLPEGTIGYGVRLRVEGVDITRAPEGVLVGSPEDYGMLREQARQFNQIIDKRAAEWGHEIDIMVRPTNKDSLGHLAEMDGKPEPIKAKSINVVDLKGGWSAAGTEGTIGYYTPEQISASVGVPPERIVARVPDPEHPGELKWVAGQRPSSVPEDVWDRAVQRVKEYWDEKAMMDQIVGRGLAHVDANGQVINQGISGYALDPDTHALVERPGAQAKGLGKPIVGDPDVYMFTDGKGNALPLWKQKVLEADLGAAGVKHGAITAWDPHEPKNIAIQAKILSAHAGRPGADGVIVGATDKAENLIVFRGRYRPRVTAWDSHIGESGPGLHTLPDERPGAAGGARPIRAPVAGDDGMAVWWVVDPHTGGAWPLDPTTGAALELPDSNAPVGPDVDAGDALDGILKGAAAAFGPPPIPQAAGGVPAQPPTPVAPTPALAATPVSSGGIASVSAGTPSAPAPPTPPSDAPSGIGGWLTKWGKVLVAGALGVVGLAVGLLTGGSPSGVSASPTSPVPVVPAPVSLSTPTAPTTPTTQPPPTSPVSESGNTISGTATSPNGQPVYVFAFEFTPPLSGITLSCPGASSTDFTGPNGSPECLFSSPIGGTPWTLTGTSAFPSPLSVLFAFSFDNSTYQTFGSPLTVAPVSTPKTEPTTPATPAASQADGLGTVDTAPSGGGVNVPLAAGGGGLLALAGAAFLLIGRKKCSCAEEYERWQAAIALVQALEQKDNELVQVGRMIQSQIDAKQAEQAAWQKQVAPFEQYIAAIENYIAQLLALALQLQAMTGPLVTAGGSLSSTPKPGWVEVNPHLWASSPAVAKGAELAAELYQTAVFNGMVMDAISQQIYMNQQRIDAAQKQLDQAQSDLFTINWNVNACDTALRALRDQQNANTAERNTVAAQLKDANAKKDAAFAAYEACKKNCPDG